MALPMLLKAFLSTVIFKFFQTHLFCWLNVMRGTLAQSLFLPIPVFFFSKYPPA